MLIKVYAKLRCICDFCNIQTLSRVSFEHRKTLKKNMMLMISAFSKNTLNISTMFSMFFHVFRCSKLIRESAWMLQKNTNSPKFSMHFYEHAECLIVVCFRIFSKVSSKGYTLLAFYYLKERPRSPGFDMFVFRCLFQYIPQ